MKDRIRYDEKAENALETKWIAEIKYMLQHKRFYSSRWAPRKWGNWLFRTQIKAGQRVCECGCFLAIPSIFLALTNPETKVYAFDISPVAVLRSKRLSKKSGARINLTVTDFRSLPFEDSCFDWMFGFGVLHHCHSPETIKEIQRTLCSGGKAVFVEPHSLNQLIRVYRKARRESYSSTERPYDYQMLHELQKWAPGLDISWRFEHFFSTFAVLVFTLLKKLRSHRPWLSIYGTLLGVLGRLDDILLGRFPGLTPYSQQIVLVIQKKG